MPASVAIAACVLIAFVFAGPAFVGLAVAGGSVARASSWCRVLPKPRSRPALGATALKKKAATTKKSKRYVGSINPRLRSLVNSPEYQEVLELLETLQDRKLLDGFLEKLEDYMVNLDVFELALQETKGGGVMRKIKQDWPRIFPKNTEFRLESFEAFARLWVRIGRSKCLDDLMQKVLPTVGGDYRDMMDNEDQKKLMDMSAEERETEIIFRLASSPMVTQLGVLTSENKVAAKVAPAVAPVLQRLVIGMERKMAEQTEKLGSNLDIAAAVGGVVVLLLILYGLKVFPNM